MATSYVAKFGFSGSGPGKSTPGMTKMPKANACAFCSTCLRVVNPVGQFSAAVRATVPDCINKKLERDYPRKIFVVRIPNDFIV